MSDGRAGSEPGRRAVLGGVAAVASTAGCVKRVRNVLGRDPSSQISLRILTVPADADPHAIRIARELASNLRDCGVDAGVTPMSPEELYRQVLINQSYDIYVGQFPSADWTEPDRLYPLLHSVYASETGWQNPFEYTNLNADSQLEAQRTTTGSRRRAAVDGIQATIGHTQPFTTVAFPDSLATLREDRFRLGRLELNTSLTLLGLRPVEAGTRTLRLVSTDTRVTANRNPLAAEFRKFGTFTDLLYDPLARRLDGVVRPWLAESWRVTDRDDRPAVALTLREGLTWHDGEPITAEDVQFTYRFLADTSLGEAESPIPAPRFRGRASLVEDVEVIDDRTATVRFAETSVPVAPRSFTVPLLPKHVWIEQTGRATLAGVDANRVVTEALVWNNPDPVGSGPLEFESAIPAESLRLSRFDDHFLHDGEAVRPEQFAGAPAYREIRLRAVGSDDSAVEVVASGEADATVAPLGPGVVPRIGRSPELRLLGIGSRAFYHVGYNTSEAPLSNPRFRSVVARLLDKSAIVEDVFDGYARPAAGPLAGTRWLADDLQWTGTDPMTPFLGTDGDLDAEAAREALVDAGYRYSDGKLLDE